jgi:hypothetical protein
MTQKDDSKESEVSDHKQAEAEDNSSILDDLMESPIGTLLGGVVGLSGQAVKVVSEKTWDQALKFLKYTPEQMELMGKAGTSLKDARNVAGLTLSELSSAVDLENPDLLRAVEEGKAGLPFEILLRLASFYARNDPIPFIMKFARTYNPGIWEVMKTLGLDKLTLEAERELQFLNIYRSHDEARQLSDEGFERVSEFTRQAFEMALHFVAEQENIEYEEYEVRDDEADGEETEAGD